MKIIIDSVSDIYEELEIISDNLENTINDLRNGKINISSIIDVNCSFLCDGIIQNENPNRFIISFPKNKNKDYDCRITIYDYYIE